MLNMFAKPNNLIIFSLLFSFFLLNSCEEKSISIQDMWIRLPLKGKSMTAGFLKINNSSKNKISLISASSSVFNTIELHTMKIENSYMKMQHVDFFEAEPGKSIILKPHANHLMLIGLKKKLSVGDTVNITLKFKNLKSMTLPMIVKKDY